MLTLGTGGGGAGDREKKGVGKTSVGELYSTHFTAVLLLPDAQTALFKTESHVLSFSALKQNACTIAADDHSSRASHDDTCHREGGHVIGHDELVTPQIATAIPGLVFFTKKGKFFFFFFLNFTCDVCVFVCPKNRKFLENLRFVFVVFD